MKMINQIKPLLDFIPVSMYWKDKKGKYLEANDEQIKVSGISSYRDIIGATDFDLIWCEQAPQMIRNDQKIIYTECTETFIESVKKFPENRIVHYISHKTPLWSQSGKVIGITGVSYQLDNKNNAPFFSNKITTSFNHIANHPVPLHVVKLTKRQMECLYYLSKGKTVKKIAAHLRLSPRTIEHYLDAIKQKLNCYSRSELIEKALQFPEIREKL